MDIEVILNKDRKQFPGQGKISEKHVLCDIWLVKASELGINNNLIHTRTHIGHLLKTGDTVLCYNIEDANINNIHYEKLNKDHLPNIIIVKKYYGDSSSNHRNWKLKYIINEDVDYNRTVKYVIYS